MSSKIAGLFYIPISHDWEFVLFCIALPAFGLNISTEKLWVFIVVLICDSPMTPDMGHLFMCFFAICTSILMVSVETICSLLTRLLLCIVELHEFFVYTKEPSFTRDSFCKYFPLVCGLSSCFLESTFLGFEVLRSLYITMLYNINSCR